MITQWLFVFFVSKCTRELPPDQQTGTHSRKHLFLSFHSGIWCFNLVLSVGNYFLHVCHLETEEEYFFHSISLITRVDCSFSPSASFTLIWFCFIKFDQNKFINLSGCSLVWDPRKTFCGVSQSLKPLILVQAWVFPNFFHPDVPYPSTICHTCFSKCRCNHTVHCQAS